jgi:hypothetical protein
MFENVSFEGQWKTHKLINLYKDMRELDKCTEDKRKMKWMKDEDTNKLFFAEF